MSEAKRHRLDELERTTPHLRTLDEMAAYLRMDKKTVVELIRTGELHVRIVGGQYRATQMQLDRFIEAGAPQ